jgi:ABC transporter substrate binding protein
MAGAPYSKSQTTGCGPGITSFQPGSTRALSPPFSLIRPGSRAERRTAELVDKILRGTKPGDIPVEQPSRFELVINLTAAKVLGLAESFILRADEVIE